MSQPLYNRILIKLSGEVLNGGSDAPINPKVLHNLAEQVKHVLDLGVQVAIVIGGGNFFRGANLSQSGISRITGDHMGMLATLMNALALRDAFDQVGMSVRVLSAIPLSGVVDLFNRRKAMHHLNRGRVVIFAAGTGNPLFTTDSAASLRGIEVKADVLLKATNVDGVYDKDPNKHADAKKYDTLSFATALEKELAVMDLAAFCQCRDHDLPIRVFNIQESDALKNVVTDAKIGTHVINK
jgi:uridylate kinase